MLIWVNSRRLDYGKLGINSTFRVKEGGVPSTRGPIGAQFDRRDEFALFSGSEIEQIEINVKRQDRQEFLERVGLPRKLNLKE